jgi:hypothetical protein
MKDSRDDRRPKRRLSDPINSLVQDSHEITKIDHPVDTMNLSSVLIVKEKLR